MVSLVEGKQDSICDTDAALGGHLAVSLSYDHG